VAVAALLAGACNRPQTAGGERVGPSRAQARDPEVEPLVSHLAVDLESRHLVAVSRKERTIGAIQIFTRQWSWSHKAPRQPGLVAVYGGEGFLVWGSGDGAELVRFRPATGDTVGAADLGPRGVDDFRVSAFDPAGPTVYLATDRELLAVDLRTNRLLPGRAFPGVVDLAVDESRRLLVLSHRRGVTWVGLAGQPGGEIELEAAPGGVAADPGSGLLYVVAGRKWIEIDLDAREVVRHASFEPEHDFSGARVALAASCRRLYLAADHLAEVDLDSGRWEPIVALGSPAAPLLHASALGALFTIHQGRIFSSYQRCPAEEVR